MATLFVSYSSHDKASARQIASDIRAHGHSVWLDEWEIRVGECIPSRIQGGLEGADFVVVLLSRQAVNSRWVDREWKTAFWDEVSNGRTAVLPALLEQCSVPELLKPKKYANLVRSYEDGLRELLDAIDYYEQLDRSRDFYRSISLVWAEERSLTDSARSRRNEHWDGFEAAVDALTRDQQWEVQRMNSLHYIDKYGLSIRELKQELSRLGTFHGAVDDTFGPDLARALLVFQQLNALRHHDGVFGPVTYLKMAEVSQAMTKTAV